MPSGPEQFGSNAGHQRLRETLERALVAAESEPRSEALLDELRAVASRHGGAPMALDPMGVEVVQALIRRRLGVPPERAGGLRRIAAEVAMTLWGHPEGRRRLERLWSSVAE